jgi:hypothetical protein
VFHPAGAPARFHPAGRGPAEGMEGCFHQCLFSPVRRPHHLARCLNRTIHVSGQTQLHHRSPSLIDEVRLQGSLGVRDEKIKDTVRDFVPIQLLQLRMFDCLGAWIRSKAPCFVGTISECHADPCEPGDRGPYVVASRVAGVRRRQEGDGCGWRERAVNKVFLISDILD